MAYVVADLGLIGVVTFVLAITGWHLDRSWIFVLVGCVVFSVADTAYLYATATETYQEGALMDAGWLAGIALIAVAAWQPRRPVVAVRVTGSGSSRCRRSSARSRSACSSTTTSRPSHNRTRPLRSAWRR